MAICGSRFVTDEYLQVTFGVSHNFRFSVAASSSVEFAEFEPAIQVHFLDVQDPAEVNSRVTRSTEKMSY